MNCLSSSKVMISILIISLCGVSCHRTVLPKELSKEQIVEIAEQRAEKEGITSEYHQIVFDANKLWEQKIEFLTQKHKERIVSQISGRNYQVVLFQLKPNLLGGDLWIFVDKKTGEILTLYGEE